MLLDILYQDDHYVAIDKPSGLLVHRSEIDRHETQFAMQLVRDQLNQRVFPVHRLDKPTSGVLLFALSQQSARDITNLFTAGQVSKRYMAVTRGYIHEPIHINYPLKEKLDKMTDSKAKKDKPAREAISQVNPLATIELPYSTGRYSTSRYSAVEVIPKTGRKHQIRRHLKHVFHPIIGDTSYGDGRHNNLFREYYHLSRLLLSATELSFKHPYNHQNIIIKAGLNGEFKQLMDELPWQWCEPKLTRFAEKRVFIQP